MHYLIIISLLSYILEYIAPILIKYIVQWMYNKSDSDFNAEAELMDIKREMNSISMVDEFAKYAKLQRRYNKLDGEYKTKVNSRLSSRAKVSLFATYGFRFINFLIMFILMCQFRGVLVIETSKGTFGLLDPILSWPSPEGTGISFLQWTVMSKLTTSVVKRRLVQ